MPNFSRLHMRLKDASTGSPLVGEATDRDYRDQIQLTNFSWDMGRKKADGGSKTRGEVQPGEFEFSKTMDRASTAMLSKMRNGVRLHALVTIDSQEESSFKLTVELTDVRIIDYRVSAKDGEKSGEISEDWTFTYSKLVMEYQATGERTRSTTQQRPPDSMSGKAVMDAVLNAFKDLNDPWRIDAVERLRQDYPKSFAHLAPR